MFIPGPLRPADTEFVKKWMHKLPPEIKPLSTESSASFDHSQQIQNTFAFKWTKQDWWGMDGATAQFFENWIFQRYGWKNKDEYKTYFADKKLCLDAGCGLGRETIRMAIANPDALIIGLELSECIDEACKHASARGLKNIFFIQADINNPPIARQTFDFIISEGVLHHTPDTKKAFLSLVSLLAKKGEIGFYVYREKAVLREFADDYIREKIANLNPEQAWKEMESFTRLGKVLSELQTKVNIDFDIPLLGIKAGEYDLQRFIYYNILKCFWNPDFTFEENVHVNYDWYAPKYAWRHTEQEVCEWIKESGLTLTNLHIEESGITVRAIRGC